MKLHIMSDLHLETGSKIFLKKHEDTSLVLAGDIDSNLTNLCEFFLYAMDLYDNVFFTSGNHEYYHNDFIETNKVFNTFQKANDNFFLLKPNITPQSFFQHPDIDILGCTLWSSPAWGVFNQISDSQVIAYDGKRISSDIITSLNEQSKRYLKAEVKFLKEHEPDKKIVIITHFGPDQVLMHPKWRDNPQLNTYFWSEGLSDLFEDVDYWIFGHTHDPIDIVINGCRFICNPHGYRSPEPGYNPELIIDI